MEFRPLPADDERFRRAVAYAFHPEEGPDAHDDDPLPRPDSFAGRGLFPDGSPADAEPVAVCGRYRFETQIRETDVALGGVAAVATPPEHRRRGHVRTTLAALSRELREEGVGFSALWPFDRAFYRRLGWATTNRVRTCEAPPEQLLTASERRTGRWTRVGPDEWRALEEVSRRAARDLDLVVARTEDWWRYRVFRSWRGDPYVYLWRDGDGRPGAYVVYAFEAGDELADRTLRVRETAAVDDRALRQVCAFLGDHDSQVDAVEVRSRDAHDLLDLVADPSALSCTVRAGPMVRVEDPTALARLALPADEDRRLVFELSDPLVPENDGRYALSVADGAVDCRRTDERAAAALTSGQLGQLAVGYRTAEELAGRGELGETDDAAVAGLSALFPPRDPSLQVGF